MLFYGFLVGPVQHFKNIILNKEYRRWCWYRTRYNINKRFQPKRIRYENRKIYVPDITSFIYSFKSIFVDHIYDFKSYNSSPEILDLGANIGLSIIRFKQLFPNSKIHSG